MLYPMFAMVLLTCVVAGYLLSLRINAVKSKQLKLSQFRLNNSSDIPEAIAQAARNYSNLFEVPLLFYAAGILTLVLRVDSTAMLICAWGFVLTRVVHSWIHITNNNVVYRLYAFAAGLILVLTMWLLLLASYSFHP